MACGSGQDAPGPVDVAAAPGAGDAASLRGAGSDFIEPLLDTWVQRYAEAAPAVSIEHRVAGPEAAIEALLIGQVDFVTREIPLEPAQRQQLELGADVAQVPWAVGAVALVYNLPDAELRLSPELVARILTGAVTSWGSPEVRALNPTLRADVDIAPVVREDGSGATAILAQFLADRAPGAWNLGRGPEVDFQVGALARGDGAVIEAVRTTVGAIGYVAAPKASAAGLPVALLQNAAGEFRRPSPAGMRAALDEAVVRANDTGVALQFDSPGRDAYPLSTPTYVVIRAPREQSEGATVALRRFVEWALTRGRSLVALTGFETTPPAILDGPLVALERFG